MGNYSSTRWKSHWKKYTVEDAQTLYLKTIYSSLQPGHSGMVLWNHGEETVASISYRVWGINDVPVSVQLEYNIGAQLVNYAIYLSVTALPWGGYRFWFTCPNEECQRRTITLHLIPGSLYFFCRNCNNLTYRSSQESGVWARFLKEFGTDVFGDHPYITGKDVAALLEGKFTNNVRRMATEKALHASVDLPDTYSDYLTAEELCCQSGLSSDHMISLNEHKLLVPDRDHRFRPRLLQWAKKLAYLIDHGWQLTEIKSWANGRFMTKNPKQWPPDRARWQA